MLSIGIRRSAAIRSRGSAFTIIELLVVITIIGILIALLLPAVQATRESARATGCKNNLKQIGLALETYHTVYAVFPPGYIVQPHRTEAWGWPVFILPYLEEKGLYEELNVNKRRLTDLFAEGTDIPLVQTPLPVFRCPSDTTPDLLPEYPRHFRGIATPPHFEPATSNYVGDRGFYDRGGPFRNNGTFFGDSDINHAAIIDGKAHTFFVGERDERCSAGTWIGSRNPPGPGMWGAYMLLGRVSMKLNDPTTTVHDTCTEGFSSAHPGGAHFLFCDGSVKFIIEHIDFSNAGLTAEQIHKCEPYNAPDLGVYQRLGIINDCEIVGEY